MATRLIGNLPFVESIEMPVYPVEERRTIGRAGHGRFGQAR